MLVSLVRVVCLIKSANQLVHGIETGVSAGLGSRRSRFNGSSWISFSSLHSCQTDAKPEVPVGQSTEFGHGEQPVQLESGEPVVHASGDHEVRGRVPLVLRSESEERVVHTSEEHEACERLPMVVPSRAWVDEVKTFKKGDVYIGRGSKQRGLLPSFWANRNKVSKFRRDRAVELHATEVQEDPQYRLRIHELSGKRLLCHCRAAEKCHADNLRALFRAQHPQAFDPSSSSRPPVSSELNILAKAREDREDSEESGLEDAEADAPQGWPGTGKLMLIGSGYVERRLCDGLLSGGLGARGSLLSFLAAVDKSISRLFLGTAEFLSSVQLLGRHAKPPFSQSVVDQLRGEVKVILAREGFQFERVEGQRTNVPIDFRLLGGLLKAATDPEVSIASFAQGVRVGPGSRMPRLPKTWHEEEEVADPGAERASRC